MKTIYLHGYLKEKFGEKFNFNVSCPAQAIRGLFVQIKELADAVKDGKFGIIRGDLNQGDEIDIDECYLRFGKTTELHIVPILEGSGGRAGGIVKIVLGVALLGIGIAGAALAAGSFAAGLGAAAFGVTSAVSYGTLAIVGLALTVTGISSVLTPRVDMGKTARNPTAPDYSDQQPADERPSFLLSAPTNQFEQGGPVPLVYGRMRVGSTIVSLGLVTEAI